MSLTPIKSRHADSRSWISQKHHPSWIQGVDFQACVWHLIGLTRGWTNPRILCLQWGRRAYSKFTTSQCCVTLRAELGQRIFKLLQSLLEKTFPLWNHLWNCFKTWLKEQWCEDGCIALPFSSPASPAPPSGSASPSPDAASPPPPGL